MALTLPIFILLFAYIVDYGYFFAVSASITAAAHSAAQYSAQGSQSSTQTTLPSAGPLTNSNSVAALAVNALTGFLAYSTTTTVQVCSKSIGTASNLTTCSAFGPTGATYTPATDPEAPTFYLQRVDVTYTVQPPIPMSFFKFPLISSMQFHRQVSMRALD